MIGQGLGRVAQAEKLSIQQLEEALENRTIPAYIGIPLLEEKVQLEKRMKMAQAGMSQVPQMTIADQVMDQAEQVTGGIDQAPIDYAPSMAGGGIVAFGNGGQVQRYQNQGLVEQGMTEEERAFYERTGQLPPRLQNYIVPEMGIAPPMPGQKPPARDPGIFQRSAPPLDPTKLLEQTNQLYGGLYKDVPQPTAPGDKMGYVQKAEDFFKKAGVDLELASKQAAEIAKDKEALKEDRKQAEKDAWITAGLAMMAGTSANAFENIGLGALKGRSQLRDDIKAIGKLEREADQASRQMAQAQNQIRMGVATAADQDYKSAVQRFDTANEKIADRKATLMNSLMSDSRAREIVNLQMSGNLQETTRIIFNKLVSEGRDPNDPKTLADARQQAYVQQSTGALSGQASTRHSQAAERTRKRIDSLISAEGMKFQRLMREGKIQEAEELRRRIYNEEYNNPSTEIGSASPSMGQTPSSSQKTLNFADIPS